MNNIIKYITANNIDTKLYYFDKYTVPKSIMRNVTMHKSHKLNIKMSLRTTKLSRIQSYSNLQEYVKDTVSEYSKCMI